MDVQKFDHNYYSRYYIERKTRVAEPAYFDKLARLIVAYCDFIDVKVRSILDLGCGIGTMKKPLLERLPKAHYTGVDVSAYACNKYGWQQGSVVDYETDPCDLVICHDVVQYLNAKDAKAALQTLENVCEGVLYFGVLTAEDWNENCDRSRTDGDVEMRSAAWYRKHLAKGFKNLGGGLYLSRRVDIALYALEHLD